MFTGKKKIFKYLYEKGADLSHMDAILNSFNLSAIDIICERGYLELLQFYLPIYLNRESSSPDSLEPTLNLASNPEIFFINILTPIQKACEKGQIAIIMQLYKYFKSKKFIPRIFDINYSNEKTGENCALIACRKGNYNLIKALYTCCDADFNVKNKYDENPIVICACAYRLEKNRVYLDCIKYLIEKIGIDVTYMHEEILLLSECEELTYYIEQQLQLKDIYITKLEVDEKYKIKREVFSDSYEGNSSVDFFNSSIRRYIEGNETKSQISLISQYSSKTDFIYENILGC